jgi:hypothetical protein
MFTFTNYGRRFPMNARLSRYCTESTNYSIKKLTQEMNEERKCFLVKKYFNDNKNNNNDNNDNNNNNNNNNDDNNNNNNSGIIITIASILSAFYFVHKLYIKSK